eukprot:sb/3477907/
MFIIRQFTNFWLLGLVIPFLVPSQEHCKVVLLGLIGSILHDHSRDRERAECKGRELEFGRSEESRHRNIYVFQIYMYFKYTCVSTEIYICISNANEGDGHVIRF